MCDIILASPTAKFGQPEINLGVIPGGGGSQRLAHIIGKSRAMEMVLTGRNISAQEAEKWGMVSRVVGEGEGEVVTEALAMAKLIASKSQIAVQAGKEVVNAGLSQNLVLLGDWCSLYHSAYELNLAEGLRFERRIFHGLFATKDQKEGEHRGLFWTCNAEFPWKVWLRSQRRGNPTSLTRECTCTLEIQNVGNYKIPLCNSSIGLSFPPVAKHHSKLR